MAAQDLNATQAHLRRALVIGNTSYTRNPLNNCVNDADDLAVALRDLGFKVSLGIDCTHQEMGSLIRTFGKSIKKQDLVLFYFAGHGIQYRKQNYLLPIDADDEIQVEKDIETASINAQHTLERLASETSYITLFILDCCRSYRLPFTSKFPDSDNLTAGLRPMTSPGGTLIQFASAPGTIEKNGLAGERNGLYTKHLLKHIKTPNKDLDSILETVSSGVYKESRERQMPNTVSTIMIGEPIFLNRRRPYQALNPDNTKPFRGIEVSYGPLPSMSICYFFSFQGSCVAVTRRSLTDTQLSKRLITRRNIYRVSPQDEIETSPVDDDLFWQVKVGLIEKGDCSRHWHRFQDTICFLVISATYSLNHIIYFLC